MLLFLNLGSAELLIILIVLLLIVAIPIWGFKAGSVRTIGGGLGLVLALLLSLIGIVIIYSFPKIDSLVVNDIPEQLRKYKELLDNGTINESEFQIQKERLLM